MRINSTKVINAIGIATTVIGIGLELLSSWVNDKQMEEIIEEKVNEALAKRENKKED